MLSESSELLHLGLNIEVRTPMRLLAMTIFSCKVPNEGLVKALARLVHKRRIVDIDLTTAFIHMRYVQGRIMFVLIKVVLLSIATFLLGCEIPA